MQLTDEQKKTLIEQAQDLYRTMFDVRCQEDPFADEVDIRTFKEACQDMSCLVHYLAKEMYNVPDEENVICHCIFKYSGCSGLSHFYNVICGRIVDSTIMQFNDFSPYDNHDDCYTNITKSEYSDIAIKREIELYEMKKLMWDFSRQRKNMHKKITIVEKFKQFVRERIHNGKRSI